MSLVDDNRLLVLFTAVVLTTLGAVGLGLFGVLATVTTLLTGGPILGTMALAIFGPLLLLGLDVVFAVALLRELRQRARLPKHQGLADWLARLERFVPPLSRLGLADRFEPGVDARRQALARRYVDGDLSEAELEAELDALLDEEPEDEESDQRTAVTVEHAEPRSERVPERVTERSQG